MGDGAGVELKKRGGAIRWRTIKPSPDTYMHVAIVKKKGKRGGRTIAGKLKELYPNQKRKKV